MQEIIFQIIKSDVEKTKLECESLVVGPSLMMTTFLLWKLYTLTPNLLPHSRSITSTKFNKVPRTIMCFYLALADILPIIIQLSYNG